jgi:membrane-associated phospholipid phosphatase
MNMLRIIVLSSGIALCASSSIAQTDSIQPIAALCENPVSDLIAEQIEDQPEGLAPGVAAEDESAVLGVAPSPQPKDKSSQFYKLSYWDIPVFTANGAWTLYTFSKIYYKDRSPEADVLALDRNNVNGFDRWAAGKQNKQLARVSDYLFYGSMPLPIFLMADKKIRKDGLKIGFLYLEAMAITGTFYGSSPYFVDRYRPEIYKTDLTMEERTNVNGRNSFIAGHVATVATSTFFCAQVYADYHPESNFKYVLYGAAALATGVIGYLRIQSGKHFPTDVILGTAVGTLSGILVPYFHRNKSYEKQAWRLTPYIGDGYGLCFTYKL